MRPMLASVADAVPTGGDWVHEVKWDGMRILADVRDGRLTLFARSGNDVTASFPELESLAGTYDDLLLDGEVVALDGGRPSFAALAERMHVQDRRKASRLAAVRPVTFMIFDLLRLFGQDLTAQPWTGRRDLLDRLALDSRHWQVPPTYDDGRQLLAATREQGLEGIVSKRRDAAYLPGRRVADWRKTSNRHTVSVVVGGWRPETGNPARLGALLVGLPGPDGWVYAGRIGSGVAGKVADTIAALLAPLTRATPPFADQVPALDARGATWVEPVIVVDLRHLGETGAGRLRQPSFHGIRHDLSAQDVLDA
ncbi:MAG: non-homologous end-joining DNA ligase [Tetrasphaera sp.]|jgi:bifunctional non-homologous end joining protein LigD|nr:non-homologous end-joining DNA ligase [Tetrasphaera sp.]